MDELSPFAGQQLNADAVDDPPVVVAVVVVVVPDGITVTIGLTPVVPVAVAITLD